MNMNFDAKCCLKALIDLRDLVLATLAMMCVKTGVLLLTNLLTIYILFLTFFGYSFP